MLKFSMLTPSVLTLSSFFSVY